MNRESGDMILANSETGRMFRAISTRVARSPFSGWKRNVVSTWTPHESQLIAQYRTVLRNAIDSGDWSQLSIVRGLPSSPGRITFVPGPR